MALKRRTFLILSLLFFASGAAVLGLELVWARQLQRLMGSSAWAVSGVLCGFLGGMGAGAFVAERVLRRGGSPLRLYASAEFLAAGTALLFSFVLPRLGDIFLWPGGDFLLVLAVAVAVAPAGATLPFAVASFSGEDRAAFRLRSLYGWNAIGAALGAVIGGLILLPRLGEERLAVACISVLLLVAIVATVLAGRQDAGGATDSVTRVVEQVGPGVWSYVFLSGFVVFYWEVLWTRLLTLTVGGTVYAFAVVAGSVILGIGCGSLWVGLIPWRRHGGWWLPALVAAVLIVAYFFVDGLSALYLAGIRRFSAEPLFWGCLTAGAIAFVPNFLLGGLLPWLAARTPKSLGGLYALNAAGCVLGAWLAGPIGAAWWSLESGYALGVGGLCGLISVGIVVGRFTPRREARGGPSPAESRVILSAVGVALVVAVGLSLTLPRWDVRRLLSGVYQWSAADLVASDQRERMAAREVLEVVAGREVIVSVEAERAVNTLYVRGNGKVEGSLPLDRAAPSLADMPTQVLLGELPVALLPPTTRPRLLLIGLGSGVSLGACLHAGATRFGPGAVDVIEIEQAFLHALQSESARRYLHGILPAELLAAQAPTKEDRWRFHFGDARRLLRLELGGRRWHAIVSQPSEPWIPAAAPLFTEEFFTTAAARLESGGIFVQWLQMYKIDEGHLRLLVRTFRRVFPEVYLFRPPGTGELLLLGSAQRPPLERLLTAPDGPFFNVSGFEVPVDRLASILLGPRGVDRWVGLEITLPVHRDASNDLVQALTASLYGEPERARRNLDRFRDLGGGDPCIGYLPENLRSNSDFRLLLAERNFIFGDFPEAFATLEGLDGAPVEALRRRISEAMEATQSSE